MPSGTIDWGTTPGLPGKEGRHGLDHHRQPDQHPQECRLPVRRGHDAAAKARRQPTGGGNFYIFKSGTPEQQQAALKFAQWVTTPERAADWSIATGYVAVTPAAWQTDKMKKYAQDVPAAAVARDQLEVSVAEFSTHENQRVTKVLNDALQAVLTGSKAPQQALTDAQREADRILRSYK